MLKRVFLTIIALIMIITGSTILVDGEKIDIDIQTDDDGINIIEKYLFEVTDEDIISFWIQSGHSNVVITIDGSDITPAINNNIYYVNITEFDITSNDIIQVMYNLDRYTYEFEKILQYDTNLITISFDENEIYSGKNLSVGGYINIALQKQVAVQNVEEIPFWMFIIVIILAILLIIVFINSVTKQKSTTKKETIGGSKELLTTKKVLLMEILKEIEKRHRSKQISDDTYNKLKDEYKRDAVEAMKHLEDLKK
jgi:hypothetical protein